MKFQVGDLFYIELFDKKLKTVNNKRQLEYEDILIETKTLCIIDCELYGNVSEEHMKAKVFKLQYGNGRVLYLPPKYLESFIDQPRLNEKWTYYPVNI